MWPGLKIWSFKVKRVSLTFEKVPKRLLILFFHSFFISFNNRHCFFVVDWWNNVYGFDMSSIGSSWKDDAIVDTCKKTQVVTETQQIREIYLQIFEKEDIPFEEKFSLKMKRDDYVNVSIVWYTIGTKNHI